MINFNFLTDTEQSWPLVLIFHHFFGFFKVFPRIYSSYSRIKFQPVKGDSAGAASLSGITVGGITIGVSEVRLLQFVNPQALIAQKVADKLQIY